MRDAHAGEIDRQLLAAAVELQQHAALAHLLVGREVDRRDLAGGRGVERDRPVRPGGADGLDAGALGTELHRLDEDGGGAVSAAAALGRLSTRGARCSLTTVPGRHQRPAVPVGGDAEAAQDGDERELLDEAHSNSRSPEAGPAGRFAPVGPVPLTRMMHGEDASAPESSGRKPDGSS